MEKNVQPQYLCCVFREELEISATRVVFVLKTELETHILCYFFHLSFCVS